MGLVGFGVSGEDRSTGLSKESTHSASGRLIESVTSVHLPHCTPEWLKVKGFLVLRGRGIARPAGPPSFAQL